MNCILLYGSNITPLIKHGGVFRLASELRKNSYSVQCIDICAFLTCNQLHRLISILEKVIDEKTYWLGFSTTFFEEQDKEKFNKFIEDIKFNFPKLKIISGGSRTLQLDNVDYIFKNYNEIEIIEFTDICSKKSKLKNLKYSMKIIDGSEYQEFHSSQIFYTLQDLVHPLDSLPIEISRGCIFNCKFCAFPLRGKRKGEGIKDAETLVEELTRNYEEYGIKHYSFLDDTHNDSVEKLKYLDKYVYKKLKFNIEFTAYLRLDLIMRYPEMINLLKDAGLKSALFGIETLNPKSAKVIGKGKDPKKQIEFLQELKSKEFSDILISSGFIFGLPFDTVETVEELEEFLFSNENPLDGWHPSPLGITPPSLSAKKAYFSEFDLNFEKYGYQITDKGWENKITGLTSEYCVEKINQLIKKSRSSDRYKIAGFVFNYVKRFGISTEDCLKNSWPENLKKYNLTHAIYTECKIYCDNIEKTIMAKL